MIEEREWDAPLKLQVMEALRTQTVKDMAMLIDEKGRLDLKGTYIDLYELAPYVMGDPNEGDFVGPAVGIPIGFEELKAMIKRPPSDPHSKRWVLTTNELKELLIDLSQKNNPADDEKVMCLYRLYVWALINAPSCASTANMNHLGVFCTGEEYRSCDYSVDTLVDGVTSWKNGDLTSIPGNMLLPLVSYLVYVWYSIYLQIFCVMTSDIVFPTGFPTNHSCGLSDIGGR